MVNLKNWVRGGGRGISLGAICNHSARYHWILLTENWSLPPFVIDLTQYFDFAQVHFPHVLFAVWTDKYAVVINATLIGNYELKSAINDK